jgi:glycosyltransferase involved in cell wall biosynthesis
MGSTHMTDATTEARVHRSPRPTAPLRVLLSSYVCIVGHGSEPGTGWDWAQTLADAGHDVTVVTHAVGRPENDAWLAAHPQRNLRIEYVEDPWVYEVGRVWRRGKERWLTSKQWWLRYFAWQHAALRRAKKLHASQPFDVVHHVSYQNVVTGSPMWRLGIPFIFGPAGGAETSPRAAVQLFAHERRRERLRTAVVPRTMNPFARTALRNAAIGLTPNQETASFMSAIGTPRIEMMSTTGIDPARIQWGAAARVGHRDRSGARERVVWIGKFIPKKGPILAIDAFARAARNIDIELHIMGDGPMAPLIRERVAAHGLGDRVVLHGWIPWDEAQAVLVSSDVMLFTSLRDTFSNQLIEAAAAGLPLVALDLHGVASLVPEDTAVKVPFSTPGETAVGLADALITVLSDSERRAAMSRAALRFSAQESFPRRAERMTQMYRGLLGS